MTNNPEYFKSYYEEHSDAILAKRREKYANDPDYRQKVLSSSRAYRKNRRQQPTVRIRRHQRPIEGTSLSGAKVTLLSVGVLSTVLGRSVQAINHWQKRDLLPETPYRDGRSFRFYTASMMEVIREEVGAKRRLYPVDPEMKAKISERWRALGVPVDYHGHSIEEAIGLTVAPT